MIGRTERLFLLFRCKPQSMFGLFKKKDPREAIMDRYKAMLAESHRLSTIDRKASDLKRAEAEALLDEFEKTTPKA